MLPGAPNVQNEEERVEQDQDSLDNTISSAPNLAVELSLSTAIIPPTAPPPIVTDSKIIPSTVPDLTIPESGTPSLYSDAARESSLTSKIRTPHFRPVHQLDLVPVPL